MKTSIKMLLGFAGIVLFLVLASDVVLWAYFKKGINGDGTVLRFPKKGEDLYNEKRFALHPFKAIVINTDDIQIVYGKDNDSIGIREADGQVSANYYKLAGDTLYILPVPGGGISVYCKEVQYIKIAKDSVRLNVIDLKQPTLELTAMNDCYVDMTGIEVKNFTYKGGSNNRVVAYLKGKLDNVDMQLGEYGSVNLQDIAIKNFALKADKMREFSLDEIVLLNLTQFKRN
ncbi:hypothetical protein [Chitinophaga silvisoli]|nr:hypothetical protein [Chitinophaga silvisoli]